MKIGIRAHDLGTFNDTLELINKANELGIYNIQLVYKKAFKENNIFNYENALKVSEILNKSNVKVAMLGAYFNPVHSNAELVRKNIEYFKTHLKYAYLFNCNYVGTETGSYNDDSWTYNPKNQTEEGYLQTMSVFKELIKAAKEYKTCILMEPAYGHVIYDIKTLKRAVDEINSEYLKVTIDIYNLLYLGNYQNYKVIFKEVLETFKDDVKIIHLKDFYVENGKLVQCGLGEGIIDFNYIMLIAKEYAPNATLVFEGVTGESIKTSLKLIQCLN